MRSGRLAIALLAALLGGCALFDQQDPSEIQGTVQDYPAGQPVVGAKVRLVGLNRTVVSDAKGHFQFVDLPASATIEVSAPGHQTARRVCVLAPGEVRALDVSLLAEGQPEPPQDLLFERSGRIWSADTIGGHEVCLTADLEGTQVSPTWLYGKSQFAFIQRMPGRTRVWTRYPNGKPARFVAEVPDSAAELRWHPLGEQFAFVVSVFTPSRGMVTKIRRLDINTGLQLDLLTGTLEANPAWSMDGTQLAWARRVGQKPWQIWLAGAKGERQRMFPARGSCVEPTFSPSGSQIVFSSNALGAWDLYLAGLNTGLCDPMTHLPEGGYARRPVWSTDGAEILFESNYHPALGKLQTTCGLYAMRLDDHRVRTVVPDARGAGW